MKRIAFFAALAAAALMTAACSNSGKTNVDADLPTTAEVDSVSYLVGVNFGSFIKNYDFGDLNYNEVKKGMLDYVNAKGNQNDVDFNDQFKISPEEMNRIFTEYLEKRQAYVAAQNAEEGNKFLEENKKKEGVQVTESGLQYKIIAAGSEVKAGPTDAVHVYYKGSLIDGTVFDQSPAEGEPVKLTLDRVIKGWTEGLQLIGEGGKIELYIPSELGYGENGNRAIKPNSTLIFEVELVKVGE